MFLYEYRPALASQLKELGYNLAIEPSEQDIMLTKIIFNDVLSTLSAEVSLLNHWQIRDCTKSSLRVYAYYINNPSQFNQDPRHVIPASIKNSFNTAISFLQNIYRKPPTHYIKVKNKLVTTHMDACLSIWYPSALSLATRVKHNTLLVREPDLNLINRPNIDLFK